MEKFRLYPLLLITICFAGCYKRSPHNSGEPAPQPKITIVILGSSTAAGEGATPIDSAWAYRLVSVVNKNSTSVNFFNLAVPGYTTYEAMPTGNNVANRPAPDTAKNITKALSLKPTLVMISFPTNDIAGGFTNAETLGNYAKMTHLLDSAKVQYIIFGTQPRDFTDASEGMQLKTQNDTILSVYTNHVNDFLDQLSNPDYSIKTIYSAGDGIHLNNAGHAVILNATLKQPIFTSVVH